MLIRSSAWRDIAGNMHFGVEGAGRKDLAVTPSDCLDFKSRVWDFIGGDRKAGRGRCFGDRLFQAGSDFVFIWLSLLFAFSIQGGEKKGV